MKGRAWNKRKKDDPSSAASSSAAKRSISPLSTKGAPPSFQIAPQKVLADAMSSVKHIYRLGPSLPPEHTSPVIGELQVYIPYIHLLTPKDESSKSDAATDERIGDSTSSIPSHVQIKVEWWGDSNHPIILCPKRIQHTTFLSKDPHTRSNTCSFPVRVEGEQVTKYLADARRLLLPIQDAETGRPFATALFPLTEVSLKIRRVPLHLIENGADGPRRGALIGELFVQLLIRMGEQSHLRKVLAALALREREPSIQQNTLLKGLHAEDAQAILSLVDYSSSSQQPKDPFAPKESRRRSNPLRSPLKDDEGPAHKNTVRKFQLDEAMAYADAGDSLPIWPVERGRLYTPPESQGQAVHPGTVRLPSPSQRRGDLPLTSSSSPSSLSAFIDVRASAPSPPPQSQQVVPTPSKIPVMDLAATAPLPSIREDPTSHEYHSDSAHPTGEEGNTRRSSGGGGASAAEAAGMRQSRGTEILDEILSRGRRLRDAMAKATEDHHHHQQSSSSLFASSSRAALLLGNGSSSIGGRAAATSSISHDLGALAGGGGAAAAHEAAFIDPLISASAPSDYNRITSEALWPMLDGLAAGGPEVTGTEESDEEDDLIRSLLRGSDPKGYEVQSKFPTVAAIERERLNLLERVRFLTIGIPSVTLLQAYKPPKRLYIRYSLPPHVLAPPFVQGTKVECCMSRGHTTDPSRGGKLLHLGSYVPESPSETNPLCLAVEVTDAVLNAWLDKYLRLEIMAPASTLYPDRRLRPGESDKPLTVALTEIPLRDVILSPYLSVGTTLEMRPTARLPPAWKTGEGRGGRPFIGTLALECSLVSSGQGKIQGAPYGRDRTSVSLASAEGGASSSSSKGGERSRKRGGGGAASSPSPGLLEAGDDALSLHILLCVGRIMGPKIRRIKGVIRLRTWDPWANLTGGRVRSLHDVVAERRGLGITRDFNHEVVCVCSLSVGEAFLQALRKVFQVFEVWEGTPDRGGDLVGLIKVPLKPIAEHFERLKVDGFLKSALPVLAADGVKSIMNPFTGNEDGQVEVCLALGTQEQVEAFRVVRASLTKFQARVRGRLCRKRTRLRSSKLKGLLAQVSGGSGAGEGDRSGGEKGKKQAWPTSSGASSSTVNGGGRRLQHDDDLIDDEGKGHRLDVRELGLESNGGKWTSFTTAMEDALIKHVLDVSVAGECHLESGRSAIAAVEEEDGLSASGDGGNLACFVRYFVHRSPNSTLLGQAALARNDEMLEAGGSIDQSTKAGSGLEQAVCLWWDLYDSDLNSRARHVIHTTATDAPALALCGQQGLSLQVWLCRTGGNSRQGPRLLGRAYVPQKSLQRLMAENEGAVTLRLEVERDPAASDVPARVRHLDLSLSYYREPRPVTAFHSRVHRRKKTTKAASSSAGRLDTESLMEVDEEEGAAIQPHESSQGGGQMMFGESTMVDRLVPARGRVCVDLVELTGLPSSVRTGRSRPWSLEYKIQTGKGEGVSHLTHALDEGCRASFRDSIDIAINPSFVEYIYTDALELHLMGSRDGGSQSLMDDATEAENEELARASIPLAPLLTSMAGVWGVFPWKSSKGKECGGGVKLAIYFEHRKQYRGSTEALGRSGDDAGRMEVEQQKEEEGTESKRLEAEGGGGGGSGWMDSLLKNRARERHHEYPTTAASSTLFPHMAFQQPATTTNAPSSTTTNDDFTLPTTITADSPYRPVARGGTTTASTFSLSGSMPPPLRSEVEQVGRLWLTIEEAKHLRLPASCSAPGTTSHLFIAYEWNRHVTTAVAVPASIAPVWEHSATLPLYSSRLPPDIAIILELYERPSSESRSAMLDFGTSSSSSTVHRSFASSSTGVRLGDVLLGKAIIDLSTLSAGLKELSGWYHIHDTFNRLRGQVKIRIRADPPLGHSTSGDSNALLTLPSSSRMDVGGSWEHHREEPLVEWSYGGEDTIATGLELEALALRDSMTWGEGDGGSGLIGSITEAVSLDDDEAWRSAAGGGAIVPIPNMAVTPGLEALRAIVDQLKDMDEDLLTHFDKEPKEKEDEIAPPSFSSASSGGVGVGLLQQSFESRGSVVAAAADRGVDEGGNETSAILNATEGVDVSNGSDSAQSVQDVGAERPGHDGTLPIVEEVEGGGLATTSREEDAGGEDGSEQGAEQEEREKKREVAIQTEIFGQHDVELGEDQREQAEQQHEDASSSSSSSSWSSSSGYGREKRDGGEEVQTEDAEVEEVEVEEVDVVGVVQGEEGRGRVEFIGEVPRQVERLLSVEEGDEEEEEGEEQEEEGEQPQRQEEEEEEEESDLDYEDVDEDGRGDGSTASFPPPHQAASNGETNDAPPAAPRAIGSDRSLASTTGRHREEEEENLFNASSGRSIHSPSHPSASSIVPKGKEKGTAAAAAAAGGGVAETKQGREEPLPSSSSSSTILATTTAAAVGKSSSLGRGSTSTITSPTKRSKSEHDDDDLQHTQEPQHSSSSSSSEEEQVSSSPPHPPPPHHHHHEDDVDFSPRTKKSREEEGEEKGKQQQQLPSRAHHRAPRFADSETERIARIMMGKFSLLRGAARDDADDVVGGGKRSTGGSRRSSSYSSIWATRSMQW